MNKNKELFEKAYGAMLNAYAPYSKFRVGAAVLADDGNIYAGCNTENVSYPCGTCAEAGAIAAMVAAGGRRIVSILIVCDGKILITPCGACLQRIREFADNKTEIVLSDTEQNFTVYHISDMLPKAFAEF